MSWIACVLLDGMTFDYGNDHFIFFLQMLFDHSYYMSAQKMASNADKPTVLPSRVMSTGET